MAVMAKLLLNIFSLPCLSEMFCPFLYLLDCVQNSLRNVLWECAWRWMEVVNAAVWHRGVVGCCSSWGERGAAPGRHGPAASHRDQEAGQGQHKWPEEVMTQLSDFYRNPPEAPPPLCCRSGTFSPGHHTWKARKRKLFPFSSLGGIILSCVSVRWGLTGFLLPKTTELAVFLLFSKSTERSQWTLLPITRCANVQVHVDVLTAAAHDWWAGLCAVTALLVC